MNLYLCQLVADYQNFHHGFLLLDAVPFAVALSDEVAALVTLSFRRPFSSQLNHYQTRR
jgi:hypothetical protein